MPKKGLIFECSKEYLLFLGDIQKACLQSCHIHCASFQRKIDKICAPLFHFLFFLTLEQLIIPLVVPEHPSKTQKPIGGGGGLKGVSPVSRIL